ncbi:hypothetical protein MmTuc01_1101 [Methanosarcina mazei Tuc01]|uniref:Uncharacterized protein n=1 Tax=Methanosarcina mazei Tuc01 TaxID=1236903 RepID=M1Q8J8_METMZ|nr:hypothetical protein MmTuc01_1101 [Methanosarcina mazei Tuc01]
MIILIPAQARKKMIQSYLFPFIKRDLNFLICFKLWIL